MESVHVYLNFSHMCTYSEHLYTCTCTCTYICIICTPLCISTYMYITFYMYVTIPKSFGGDGGWSVDSVVSLSITSTSTVTSAVEHAVNTES